MVRVIRDVIGVHTCLQVEEGMIIRVRLGDGSQGKGARWCCCEGEKEGEGQGRLGRAQVWHTCD